MFVQLVANLLKKQRVVHRIDVSTIVGSVAWILPINVNPVEIIILDQLHAVLGELGTCRRILRQFAERVGERPSPYARVYLDTRRVRLRDQPCVVFVSRAGRGLAGPVPRAVGVRAAGDPIPVILPKQRVGIAPCVGAPNISLLVDLEKGECVSRDEGMIQVRRFGQATAVVPLPRGVVRYYRLPVGVAALLPAGDTACKQQR
mmetsp:Transcript_3006/g.6970  ORF Transcript_3006/g.6970 Transcript_3006/m.6970 type:complete len:203 (+) Transcript_3006:1480-2088(+)